VGLRTPPGEKVKSGSRRIRTEARERCSFGGSDIFSFTAGPEFKKGKIRSDQKIVSLWKLKQERREATCKGVIPPPNGRKWGKLAQNFSSYQCYGVSARGRNILMSGRGTPGGPRTQQPPGTQRHITYKTSRVEREIY